MTTFDELRSGRRKLAVVGLGYVGLPLVAALGRHFSVIGFDISAKRISELRSGLDRTGELTSEELAECGAEFSFEETSLAEAGMIIVAVPTPIDSHRQPDLGPVLTATRLIGKHMSEGTVVVYESTVYPGVTEETCVPILEQESGRKCGAGFVVGYSPERINPGDKAHQLLNVVKVVAGMDEQTTALLELVYGTVVEAGLHRAESIRVAEAAKVIENIQRDLNIALMNELAVIFDKLGIDTTNVLAAAGTKWNFLPFKPGLVGGHCIGVDPYYLTYKAEGEGLHPEVILAGRRINDSMGSFIAQKTIKLMIQSGINVRGARVGVFGLTFKEDCPDLRNTRVVDIIRELEEYGATVVVHDPKAEPAWAQEECGVELEPLEAMRDLGAAVVAVAHSAYRAMSLEDFVDRLAPGGCLVDVKSLFDPQAVREAGVCFWRL